jgi:hypothetical protein
MPDTIVIPDDLVQDDQGDILNVMKEAKHRTLAFFDEILIGYVCISKKPTEYIKDYKLELTIRGKNDHSFSIANTTLTTIEETDTDTIYKLSSFVSFPKIKLDDPIIELSMEFHLSQEKPNGKSDYLRSGYPADRRNLLSAVKSLRDGKSNVLLDSMVKDNKVSIFPEEAKEEQLQFSESRIVSLKTSLPIIRLLNLRIRNIRMNKFNVFSTIDVEPSSKAKEHEFQISIDSIKFNFQRHIEQKFHHELPLALHLEDSYTFTFHLESYEQIIFKSLIEVDYSIANRHIKTKLLTTVDFLSLFKNNSQSQTSLKAASLAQSVQVKFIGRKSVSLGEPFHLRVRLTNTSSKSRNLVLVFNATDASLPNLPKIKSQVHPNLALLKNYTSSKIRYIGVVSLVNEVHFKSEPDKVYENDIELMGLQVGVFNMSGMKLVDVNTGEFLSCDKYLEIIVN